MKFTQGTFKSHLSRNCYLTNTVNNVTNCFRTFEWSGARVRSKSLGCDLWRGGQQLEPVGNVPKLDPDSAEAAARESSNFIPSIPHYEHPQVLRFGKTINRFLKPQSYVFQDLRRRNIRKGKWVKQTRRWKHRMTTGRSFKPVVSFIFISYLLWYDYISANKRPNDIRRNIFGLISKHQYRSFSNSQWEVYMLQLKWSFRRYCLCHQSITGSYNARMSNMAQNNRLLSCRKCSWIL